MPSSAFNKVGCAPIQQLKLGGRSAYAYAFKALPKFPYPQGSPLVLNVIERPNLKPVMEMLNYGSPLAGHYFLHE